MRLTVIGCAAAYAIGTNAASSCYLVEHEGEAIVLDIGQGAFAGLAVRRAPESLTAVFVSHLHPDHCVDLVPLRHYLRYGVEAPPGTVALHAPAELPVRFDGFSGEPGFLADFAFTAHQPGARLLGPWHVTVARVTHTDSSFAFRVAPADDAVAGLVYSGDCGDPGELAALLRPGDTLLTEASFGTLPVPDGLAHLDAAGAAAAARAGEAGRLVLTHILPEADPEATHRLAAERFGGETLLARPGLTLET